MLSRTPPRPSPDPLGAAPRVRGYRAGFEQARDTYRALCRHYGFESFRNQPLRGRVPDGELEGWRVRLDHGSEENVADIRVYAPPRRPFVRPATEIAGNTLRLGRGRVDAATVVGAMVVAEPELHGRVEALSRSCRLIDATASITLLADEVRGELSYGACDKVRTLTLIDVLIAVARRAAPAPRTPPSTP